MEMQEYKPRASRMRKGIKRAARAAAGYAAAPLPKSLEWIYGLGFKIGLFLVLKSFVAMRIFHLSITGIIMALSQLLTGIIMICLGAIMQRDGAMENPARLKRISRWYGFTAAGSAIIAFARSIFHWNFFREAASSNWFFDFINGVAKGAGEVIMSLVFWDIELWTLFCFLLFMLSFVYLNVEQPEGRIFQHLQAKIYGELPPAED